MNSKEIILANLAHSNPMRPGLTFNNDRVNDVVFGCPGLPKGYTPKRWGEGPMEYYDDMWGNIWSRLVGGCAGGEIHKAAIEDWSQLKDYAVPAYRLDDAVASFQSSFTASDKFKMAGLPWVFATSRYIRKMEVYLMDMLLEPDALKTLHAKVAGVIETLIQAAAKSGADGIMIHEDMGTQNGLLFSPALWQECFGDLYRRLFGMAREAGMKVFMHSCGQNRQILEALLQAGVHCFQFDQPTVYDLADLASVLKKHKAALWSPIDIQRILPTGDFDKIDRGVADMFKHFEGFLILKNYGDLKGIGVKPEWDQWAYESILKCIKQDGPVR